MRLRHGVHRCKKREEKEKIGLSNSFNEKKKVEVYSENNIFNMNIDNVNFFSIL